MTPNKVNGNSFKNLVKAGLIKYSDFGTFDEAIMYSDAGTFNVIDDDIVGAWKIMGVKLNQQFVGEHYWNSQFNAILTRFAMSLEVDKNPVSFRKVASYEADEIWQLGKILFVFELKENDNSEVRFDPPQKMILQAVCYASHFLEENRGDVSFLKGDDETAIEKIFLIGVNFVTGGNIREVVEPDFIWAELRIMDNRKGIEILTANQYIRGMKEFFKRILFLKNQ